MKRLLLVATILALAPLAAQGEPQSASMGFGLSKCSEFLDDTVGTGKNKTSNFLAYVSWAEGFLTGMNGSAELNGGSERNLRGFKPVEQMKHYAHYCAAHPDKLFEMAVFDFYKGLPRYRAR